MNIITLIVGTVVAAAVLFVTKLLFVWLLNVDNLFVVILFYGLLYVEAVAISRRLGVINYFESFLVNALWFVIVAALDALIIRPMIGDQYFTWQFLLAYLPVIVGVGIFHKKAHVHVRREQAKAKKK